MKTAKDYSQSKQLYYKPENKYCPHCNTPLKRSHTAWRKHIITLRATLHVTSYAHRCPNRACPEPGKVYRSAEAETLSLKYYQYGLDVIAKIGHLRFREYTTIRKIRRTIRDRFRLQVSRSEVDLLSQAYLALIQAHRNRDTIRLERFRRSGVVLAIDGVQPEKGNETLWILKDVPTGETLLARNLTSADTESISTLLREVKALGLPVRGVVSDAQRSIRIAVSRELPGIPHQLCHFHYLRNIARPISDMDRAMKVDLRKRARGVRRVERSVSHRSGVRAMVVQRYCEAIRAAMQDDGVYPLKPGGLRLYRRLAAIRRSIRRSAELQRDASLERLLDALSVLDELRPRARRVKRLHRLVLDVSRVLRREASSEEVRRRMEAILEGLRGLRYRRREDRAAVQNVIRYSESYWEGLFHAYDLPEIPRTNNDLELFIRSLKVVHRKTTGRASCQGFIVRYGAYLAFLDPSLSQGLVLSWLRLVGYDEFRRCFLGVRGFRCRLSLRRVVYGDLGGFLRDLELVWVSG